MVTKTAERTVMTVTLKQIELVQATVRQLSFERECFVAAFDGHLSKIDPDLAQRVNARNRDTSLEIVALLHLVVSALAWPDNADHFIQLLLKPYAPCNFSKSQLNHLRQAWLRALHECLGLKLTGEPEQAWFRALDLVSAQYLDIVGKHAKGAEA
jgi:hemoglobin-like flavoprotein